LWVFSLGGWSPRLPTGFPVPRGTRGHDRPLHELSPTGLLPSTADLSRSVRLARSTTVVLRNAPRRAPQPPAGNGCGLDTGWVWALPRSLAATEGISVDFFSSGYLDVSVPRVASNPAMCSPGGAAALPAAGFPIRASPDRRLLAAPRGLSQLATPFIGPKRLGIHRVPFVA